MTRNLYYGSVWKFTPQGVEEITNRFDLKVKDVNVRCTYIREKHMFRIQCIEGEDAYWQFVDMINRYIEEQAQDIDPLNDQKMVRIPETRTDTGLDMDLDLDDDFLNDDASEELIPKDMLSQGDQADDDTPSWRPNDQRIILSDLLPDSVLQSIAEDSACGLSLNVERGCILISNASGSKLQAVRNKLDNLERNSKRTKVNAHFMRTEKVSDISLRLWQLRDLTDHTLLRTLTLEGPAHRKHDALPELSVVRMMLSTNDGPKLIPLGQKGASQQQLVTDWNTLRFPAFGNSGQQQPSADVDDDVKEDDGCLGDENERGNVGEWLEEVQNDLNPDPMEDNEPAAMNIEPLVPSAAPVLHTNEHPLIARDLGFPENAMVPDPVMVLRSEALQSAATTSEHSQSTLPGKSSQRSDCSNGRRGGMSQVQQFGAGNPNSAPTSVDGGSLHSTQQLSIRSTATRTHTAIPFGHVRDPHPWERVTVTGRHVRPSECYNGVPPPRFAGPPNTNHFPPLGWTPEKPLPQVQNPPLAPCSSSTQMVQRPGNQAARMAPAVVQEDNDEGIVERLQEVDEVETRQYHSSTLHRKGKGKGAAQGNIGSKPVGKVQLPIPDSPPRKKEQNPEKQSKDKSTTIPVAPPEFSVSLREILEHAKSCKGRLEMELSFGRILLQGIKRSSTVKGFETKVVLPETMVAMITQHLGGIGGGLHFIKRMTTSLEETCHFAVGHLFEQEPTTTKAWYVFHCEDRHNNKIDINVSGDKAKDTSVVMCPENVGQAFFHFPKRQWDARFRVSVRQDYADQGLGATFAKGILVEERDMNGNHRVEMSYTASKALIVHEIYAKRQVSHNCFLNSNVTLHVTEVQHLDHDEIAHKAHNSDRAEMIQKHRLWYEAKLSIKNTDQFKQNLQLKTGEDATWQPQDVLSDELLVDLQRVIDQTVTRLDPVGLSNRGYRGDDDDMARLKLQEEEQKMIEAGGVQRGFW